MKRILQLEHGAKKEIFVTDSFLGLNENTRNCQNIETYNDCKTRLYVENLRKECEGTGIFMGIKYVIVILARDTRVILGLLSVTFYLSFCGNSNFSTISMG